MKMKVVALVSGGKDSCFNLMHCVLNGHDIVALGNLMPEAKDELDSYMYQTVGHDVIQLYGEALDLPLFRRTIQGASLNIESYYEQEAGDEVEDLYELLKEIKEHIEFDAIATGAILSNYQRVRVENVCGRLGLTSLAYLWQRDQEELLNEMITGQLNAILIKVATLGLNKQHLGKSLLEMKEHLLKMRDKYGLNVCGEGGEYETLTLDCPLFLKKIVVDESDIVTHSDDAFAPVGYLKFKKIHLEEKASVNPSSSLSERLSNCSITKRVLLEANPDTSAFFGPIFSQEPIEENNDLRIVLKFASINNVTNGSPNFFGNKQGTKSWISNVACFKCDSKTLEECIEETLNRWKDCLEKNGYTLGDICLVHFFCGSIDDFERINNIYKRFFPINPPARVCVQASLPPDEHFRLDSCLMNSSKSRREVLHVNSVSYWAPANIGPYSQAVKMHSTPAKSMYFSGSIGMNPATMEVVKSIGFEQEAVLSLRHVHVVSKVIAPEIHHADKFTCGCITCYVTDVKMVPGVVNWFTKCNVYFDSSHFILNVVCVPRLPRSASIEWHIRARVKETIEENGYEEKKDPIVKQYENGSVQHNESYFKISVNKKDLNTSNSFEDVILSKFGHFNMKDYSFIRCFYVSSVFEDEQTLRFGLLQCFSSKDLSVNISYIPVHAMCGVVILLVGET